MRENLAARKYLRLQYYNKTHRGGSVRAIIRPNDIWACNGQGVYYYYRLSTVSEVISTYGPNILFLREKQS